MKKIFYIALFTGLASSALLKTQPPRKLITELPNDSSPQYYLQQLENTHGIMNSMMVQNRRQGELKNIANNFNDMDRRLNQFRENLNRKLNELAMSLQHPKVAELGPGPSMIHPAAKTMATLAPTFNSNLMSSASGYTSYTPAPSFSTTDNPFSHGFANSPQKGTDTGSSGSNSQNQTSRSNLLKQK